MLIAHTDSLELAKLLGGIMKHKKRTFFILLVLFIIVLILLAGGIAAVITVPGPIPTPTLEPRDAAAQQDRTGHQWIQIPIGHWTNGRLSE
jgi:flagellar basal body-associated protein FliL